MQRKWHFLGRWNSDLDGQKLWRMLQNLCDIWAIFCMSQEHGGIWFYALKTEIYADVNALLLFCRAKSDSFFLWYLSRFGTSFGGISVRKWVVFQSSDSNRLARVHSLGSIDSDSDQPTPTRIGWLRSANADRPTRISQLGSTTRIGASSKKRTNLRAAQKKSAPNLIRRPSAGPVNIVPVFESLFGIMCAPSGINIWIGFSAPES